MDTMELITKALEQVVEQKVAEKEVKMDADSIINFLNEQKKIDEPETHEAFEMICARLAEWLYNNTIQGAKFAKAYLAEHIDERYLDLGDENVVDEFIDHQIAKRLENNDRYLDTENYEQVQNYFNENIEKYIDENRYLDTEDSMLVDDFVEKYIDDSRWLDTENCNEIRDFIVQYLKDNL